MSPHLMLWALPVLMLIGAIVVRAAAGEPLTIGMLLGAPLFGVAATLFCLHWSRLARAEIEAELESRNRELRESRDFLSQFVAALPVAAIVGSFEGRVIYASPAVELLLGRSPDEMRGMEVKDLYLEGRPEFERIRQLIFENSGYIDGELTVGVTPDGNAVPIELSARYLVDSTGKPVATLGILVDAGRSAEREGRQIEAERLRILGEYVAGIAHELNNPLTSVIGHLQLAEREDLPVPLRESLMRVESEALRMARTLRVLLDFVRRSPAERVPTDLNEAVSEICEFQSRPLRANGIELATELSELPHALADPNQIRQVVLNLVKNAEDAIRSSGVGGRIVARTLRTEHGFRIEVEDDGPGVPAPAENRIFENFFTTKPAGAGTGLGLAICRRIAEAHGGRIRYRPAASRGACFILDMPLQIADPPSAEPPPPPVGSSLRLMVIDDEESVRDYVATVLASEGHHVTEAGDAQTALDLIEAVEPDAVFLDMNLPDLTGPACAERILELRPALADRIVFMSGDHRNRVGDSPFLAKPMTPAQIRDVLARVAQGSPVGAD